MMSLPGRHSNLLLELDLTQPLATPDADDPLARLRARGRRQLQPTLRALHEAGDDPKVVGLIAKVGGVLPWAEAQELRIGVRAFAAAGKPTIAWAESFGEGGRDLAAYAVATAFDEIWLQPGGGLDLLGVGIEATFLRGALDRLGVEPQFEQRHEFKNAADQLMRTELTPAHRESLESVAESVFDGALEAIAGSRRLALGRLRELVDRGPYTAAEAKEAGLVDVLGYRDQAYASLRGRVAADSELMFADRWRRHRGLSLPRRGRGHVALVEVRGAIGSGRTRRSLMGRTVGSDSVGAQLRAAGSNDRVRAVVLRVDSPGGSAVASEAIWREVCRLRDAGKPVVVSMGEAAASGGYYIACPADVIVALPATLTGSIGVLGGKLVVRDLLERIGLTTGSVERGARALMYSGRRRFTEDERARFAAVLDAIYDDFVGKVAQGRGRPVAEIEPLARGRVWTGRAARDLGLVDELGGLRDAVRIARARASLPEDAPLRPALQQVSPLSRLGHAKNSEDPRALTGAVWPGPAETAAAFRLPLESVLRMPDVRLR